MILLGGGGGVLTPCPPPPSGSAQGGIVLLPVRVYSQLDPKIVSEYDQEIPQSQTADNPMTPRGRAAQPSRDTRKTN